MLRGYKNIDSRIQAALSEALDRHNLDGINGVIETYIKSFDNSKFLAFSKTFLALIDAKTNKLDFYIS